MSGAKRIPEIQSRLESWGMWCIGSHSPSNGASSPLARLMDIAAGSRAEVAPTDVCRSYIPIDAIECSKTDEAVRQLPLDLREAVRAWHSPGAGTMEQVAREMVINKTTLWRRLSQADVRIKEWLLKRRQGAQ